MKVYDNNVLHPLHFLSLYLGTFTDSQAWSGADFSWVIGLLAERVRVVQRGVRLGRV